MNGPDGSRPPLGPLLYIESHIAGKVFRRRPGELPGLEYVRAVRVTIPPEYLSEYNTLLAGREAVEQGCGDPGAWWRAWEDFHAIMEALGQYAEIHAQLLPDGRLEPLEPT